MRRDEVPGVQALRAVANPGHQLSVGIVNAHPRPEAVPLVVSADCRAQLPDVDQPGCLIYVQSARSCHVHPLVQEVPVRIENLDPVVLPVRQVDPSVAAGADVVGNVELARSVARFAPREQQASIRAVLVNPCVPVAVGHEEIAVARVDGNVRAPVEWVSRHELSRMPAGTQRQQDFAVQCAFAHRVVAVVRTKHRPVRRHRDPVRSWEYALAPGLDEIAVLVEHDHRVLAPVERVHVVVIVTTDRRYFLERETGRQLSPAFLYFVNKLPFPNGNHLFPSR